MEGEVPRAVDGSYRGKGGDGTLIVPQDGQRSCGQGERDAERRRRDGGGAQDRTPQGSWAWPVEQNQCPDTGRSRDHRSDLECPQQVGHARAHEQGEHGQDDRHGRRPIAKAGCQDPGSRHDVENLDDEQIDGMRPQADGVSQDHDEGDRDQRQMLVERREQRRDVERAPRQNEPVIGNERQICRQPLQPHHDEDREAGEDEPGPPYRYHVAVSHPERRIRRDAAASTNAPAIGHSPRR